MIDLLPLTSLHVGQVIESRYRVEKILGEGASGVVVLALDEQLAGQKLALKFLHEHLLFSSESFGRFRNETRVTMSLNHPNILQTYGLGNHENKNLYIKMEYLEGESLEDKLALCGAYSIEEAILVLRDTASALENAHRSGVIHRDLKPANILLDCEGRPKLADFGLAQMIRIEARYTGYGDILGTPYYMSPEQLRSEAVDTRADMYAFGLLAFEIITNRKPFEAESFIELAEMHFSQELPDFEAPQWLKMLVNRCVEKDRLDRYASMEEVLEILDSHCLIESLAKKSSLTFNSSVMPANAQPVSLKTSYKILGFTFHRDRFLGFGYTRLKMALIILLITLSVPHWNDGCRWRYAAATILCEEYIGFKLTPLRLLFNTPLDLKYPDSLFINDLGFDSRKTYVRPLLLLGYDPNIINPKSKSYPLHKAVSRQEISHVEWYLRYNADPNLIDENSLTALDHLARRSSSQAVLLELLLNYGANPNISSPKTVPPLAYLLDSRQIELAKLLITNGGADPNIKTNLSQPILHLAVQTQDTQLVKLLIRKGADTKTINSQGITALELAKKLVPPSQESAIVSLLEAAET